MKRIIIIGSRRRNTYEDFLIVEKILLRIYEPGDIIVSGGCRKGGDKFAELLAKKHGIPKKIFRAKWDKYGRTTAGFIRNTKVAEYGDETIACVSPDRTGGTEDTIKKFRKLHPKGKVHIC